MRDLDQYLKDFDTLMFEDIQTEYRKKKFFETLGDISINSVIEIGCGTSSIFEKRKWKENYLIEPINEFIRRLNDRIETKDIHIINSKIEVFEPNRKFDLIVLSCLLHEIDNKDFFISSIKKLMHKNSHLYIDVPNALSFHRYLAFQTGYIENLFTPTDTAKKMQQSVTVFSKISLEKFLHLNGFKIEKIGTNFIKFFDHKRMSELLSCKIIKKNDLDAFYRMTELFPEYGSELWCLVRKDND